MKKILLSFLLVFMTFSLFSQDRKVEKEIEKFYYEAINDYYDHSYDSAIYKLEILDFLYEDNSNFKFFLGMCYFSLTDFDTAISYFESSLDDVGHTYDYQNGKYTPHIVYFYMGFCYEKQGNKLKAIEYYENFIIYERDKDIIYNTKDRIKIIKLLHNIND